MFTIYDYDFPINISKAAGERSEPILTLHLDVGSISLRVASRDAETVNSYNFTSE